MSISYLAPVAAGNAVQIILDAPAGASRIRLLRKRADTISAADDAGANVIHDGTDTHVIDTHALVNGTTYYYRAFYLLGEDWFADDSRSVVPKADYADLSPDTLDLVRERLELGFAHYVERGQLQHPADKIPVMLATPATEDIPFPWVTVHMQASDPSDRFVGEVLTPDFPMGIGEGGFDEVGSVDGYLSRQTILIIVWSLNGDVRNAMRKAMQAIVVANLPVFEAAGMQLVQPSFADVDDMNTYQIGPMFQATCSLTCVAPTAVETRAPAIQAVEAILSN